MNRNKNKRENEELSKAIDELFDMWNSDNRKDKKEDIQEKLDDIFDKIGHSIMPDAETSFKDYMNQPCIEISYSRKGTSLSIKKCFKHEVLSGIPQILTTVLELIPEDKRTEMCAIAISKCNGEKGRLYED